MAMRDRFVVVVCVWVGLMDFEHSKHLGVDVGRRKVNSRVVRVTMPIEAIEGFERLAKRLHMDLGMTVRFCASMQLARFETTVLKPDLTETNDEREDRTTAVAERLLPGVFPAQLQPEPEPEPEPEPRFGFKPRGEDELAVWVPTRGYMSGL